jgi:hypothetical protein
METQVEFADGVDDRVGPVLHLGADDLVIGVVGINVIKNDDGGDFQWKVTDFDGFVRHVLPGRSVT